VPFKKEDIEKSIPARFEKQVARYPNCPAIKTEVQTVTYSQLNRAANRVARSILTLSTGSQKSVALLFEPSVDMVVAMLGVLKAGNLWVPIDPTYPEARISYILHDAQTTLLLTNDNNIDLAQRLPGHETHLINIDRITPKIPDDNLDLAISADSLACIIYTSGSTGQPKGVVQNNRNWLHLMWNYANSVHISPEDRLALIPSYSHTAGVNTIFRALLNGAAILPYDTKVRGLSELGTWLREQEITIFNSVPTLFRHLVHLFTGDEQFPKLRLIIMGGEVLYKRDVILFKQHFPPTCMLVNTLGCTELSSYRQFFMTTETQLEGNIVPVGYEVEDRMALLLDENGNEVDVGEVGEIVVKSDYLALGYWRQPELTAQAFLSASNGSNERLYRTGDMGRLLPDGCLLHLGRKDYQIQIRGYRVEIGEIETLLRDHPYVKEAVVVALENEAQEKYLVAYLVPKLKQQLQSAALRHFLHEKLPTYMVPAAFVTLNTLPLTPNGKVDRKALPAPDGERSDLQEAYAAPRTPIEEILTEIWAELLGLKRVGIHDDFFALGGHSLLANQLVSRLEAAVGITLPLSRIFEARTVAELGLDVAECLIREQ